jgi:hypothetical protein
MKPIFTISAVAVYFFVAASPCFALWGRMTLPKEEAKKMGMEVRSERAGPNQVRVELEFKTDGLSKNFSRVELQIGEGDKSLVTAPLKEDRSRPGRVVVTFTADRAQLDKARFSVWVPTGLGGMIYDLRVKDFVDPEKYR